MKAKKGGGEGGREGVGEQKGREGRGEGETWTGEETRARDSSRRGQPGELRTPALRRPRQGQQRGVRVGHWAKKESRIPQDRWLSQMQVQYPAGAYKSRSVLAGCTRIFGEGVWGVNEGDQFNGSFTHDRGGSIITGFRAGGAGSAVVGGVVVGAPY